MNMKTNVFNGSSYDWSMVVVLLHRVIQQQQEFRC
jgi:hypothetical protein